MARNSQTDFFETTAPLAGRQLDDGQRLDWLRLMRTPGIGPVTFRDLLNHYGSAANAIAAIAGRAFGKRRFRVPDGGSAEAELALAERCGAKLVALGEAGYPRYLQAIEGGPPLLYIKGDHELATRPATAIVGSRQASAAGLKFAAHLAGALGEAGFVVCSGLARGIDTQAHIASLKSGTIAVLGGGLDHIYPAENRELYQKIGSNGLLISEQPMGYRPQGRDFPRRNRLISGISLGVVVIEAAVRSGSLTTARYAGEQGRLVFAVPGHPLDPRAKGTNQLIKDGGQLVSEPGDVISMLAGQLEDAGLYEAPGLCEEAVGLNGLSGNDAPDGDLAADGPGAIDKPDSADIAALKHRLLSLLGPTPIERDSLTRLLDCETKQLQVLLLELDLEGRIAHHGGQKVSLLPGG